MTATKITNVTLMERRFSVRRFEETHSHTRDSCGKTKNHSLWKDLFHGDDLKKHIHTAHSTHT